MRSNWWLARGSILTVLLAVRRCLLVSLLASSGVFAAGVGPDYLVFKMVRHHYRDGIYAQPPSVTTPSEFAGESAAFKIALTPEFLASLSHSNTVFHALLGMASHQGVRFYWRVLQTPEGKFYCQLLADGREALGSKNTRTEIRPVIQSAQFSDLRSVWMGQSIALSERPERREVTFVVHAVTGEDPSLADIPFASVLRLGQGEMKAGASKTCPQKLFRFESGFKTLW